MNFKSYIRERISDFVFYHATDKSNLDSIKKDGLNVGANINKAQVASSYQAVKQAYTSKTGVILQIVFNKDSERDKYLKFVDSRPTNGVKTNNYGIKEKIPFKFIKVMR